MPVKPHVLVLPSDLRFFLKVKIESGVLQTFILNVHFHLQNVEDTLVVNPERLAKGVAGGTFARLEISKPADDKSFCDSVKAQVVKI